VTAPALEIGAIGPPDPSRPRGPDAWLAAVAELPLLAHPGERWLYSTGASVLGVLLSRAVGTPIEDVLRTRVLEPLRMHDTAFWTLQVDRLATAYAPGPDGLQVWDPPHGRWAAPPAFADCAGGLLSTADDLLAFARMFLRGGEPVLDGSAVAEMTRDHLSAEQRARDGRQLLDGLGWGYCTAVVVDGPRAGAFGWNGGLGTSWLVDPVRDLVVIVQTQRLFDSAAPPAVHRAVQDAAYAAIGS
jgi:CubicO group peptidase (beta-lactamase class C family)